MPSLPGQLQAAHSLVAPVNEAANFISSYSCRFRRSKPCETCYFNVLRCNKSARNKHPNRKSQCLQQVPLFVFTKYKRASATSESGMCVSLVQICGRGWPVGGKMCSTVSAIRTSRGATISHPSFWIFMSNGKSDYNHVITVAYDFSIVCKMVLWVELGNCIGYWFPENFSPLTCKALFSSGVFIFIIYIHNTPIHQKQRHCFWFKVFFFFK